MQNAAAPAAQPNSSDTKQKQLLDDTHTLMWSSGNTLFSCQLPFAFASSLKLNQ